MVWWLFNAAELWLCPFSRPTTTLTNQALTKNLCKLVFHSSVPLFFALLCLDEKGPSWSSLRRCRRRRCSKWATRRQPLHCNWWWWRWFTRALHTWSAMPWFFVFWPVNLHCPMLMLVDISVCRRLGSCSRADRGSECRNTSWLNDGWVTSASTLLNAREFLILLRLNRFHVSQMPKTYIYAMEVVKLKWRKSGLTNDRGEVGLWWSPNLIYRVWLYRTTRELEYA